MCESVFNKCSRQSSQTDTDEMLSNHMTCETVNSEVGVVKSSNCIINIEYMVQDEKIVFEVFKSTVDSNCVLKRNIVLNKSNDRSRRHILTMYFLYEWWEKSFIHTHMYVCISYVIHSLFSSFSTCFHGSSKLLFQSKTKRQDTEIYTHTYKSRTTECFMHNVCIIKKHTHLPRRKIIRTNTFSLCQVAPNRLNFF